MRGAKERRDEAILERSTKRSLLLKNWRVPNPDIQLDKRSTRTSATCGNQSVKAGQVGISMETLHISGKACQPGHEL